MCLRYTGWQAMREVSQTPLMGGHMAFFTRQTKPLRTGLAASALALCASLATAVSPAAPTAVRSPDPVIGALPLRE